MNHRASRQTELCYYMQRSTRIKVFWPRSPWMLVLSFVYRRNRVMCGSRPGPRSLNNLVKLYLCMLTWECNKMLKSIKSFAVLAVVMGLMVGCSSNKPVEEPNENIETTTGVGTGVTESTVDVDDGWS